MGFQVTPCVPPSPMKEKDKCPKGGKVALPFAGDHAALQGSDGLLTTSPFASNHLGPRSQSTNLLLSQCSSLASIPSLGLSFHGSSDFQPDTISAPAHYSCLTTLSCLGDQVACTSSPADGFFFSASSSSASFPSLKAWPKLQCRAGFYSPVAAFGSKKEGAVRALVVVGDKVFSAHDDLKVRVWARPGSGKETSCVGGGVGSAGGKHKLVAMLPTTWDCMSRSVVPGGYVQVRRHHKKLWIQHADAISALAVDCKGDILYSASWDRSVKVWRLCDFKCIESFKAHDDAINTLAFSTDGFLYTASADGKIKAWMRQSSSTRRRRHQHSLVATLEAHRSAVNALALSSNGTLLYSGACDKAIVVWERESSSTQHASIAGALRGHSQAVLCLATWGETLCSGSADRSIRVWQRMTGRLHVCVALLPGHAAPVKSLSLSQAADAARSSSSYAALTLYSAALDYDFKVWQLSFTSISRVTEGC